MNTVFVTLVVATLAASVAVLFYVYSGIYDVSVSSPHGSASTWLLETTMHASVERRADQVKVPALDDRSMVLAGVNDFEQLCVQCHGAPGPRSLGPAWNRRIRTMTISRPTPRKAGKPNTITPPTNIEQRAR